MATTYNQDQDKLTSLKSGKKKKDGKGKEFNLLWGDIIKIKTESRKLRICIPPAS